MVGGLTVEVVEVVVASGPTMGWVSVAPSEWVLGQWVPAWVCYLGFFFLVLTVDYGLLLLVAMVVSSVCNAAAVVIVVVE